MRLNFIASLLIVLYSIPLLSTASDSGPLRLGVAGLSHGHVGEVEGKLGRGDFEVVGIAERDAEIRSRNGLVKKVDPAIVFADLETMLEETRPEAVIVYESIFDHLRVVEACAPRGIHVMVEKPLAVSSEHARRMAELARKHGIMVLTNYETTWYPVNDDIREMVSSGAIGGLTRMEIYDGHQGPVEIGCGPEFLAWLTDPVLNGGGAVIDFGCYGANLATWLLKGRKPLSVYAVLKQMKPEIYPNVDDDATIILDYGDITVQVMGSWCWPMNRKDMHIYGHKGYIYQDTATKMRYITDGSGEESELVYEPQTSGPDPYRDALLYLKAAVRGDIVLEPSDQSALENNLTVVEILDAARESAITGQAIRLQ